MKRLPNLFYLLVRSFLRWVPSRDRQKVSSLAQASWVCGSIGSLILEQVPPHDPRRRRAHHWHHGEGPMRGASFISGQEVLGDWGEVGSLPLQEGGLENGIEGIFPCWNGHCLSIRPEPARLSISDSGLAHSLCSSYHSTVSFRW